VCECISVCVCAQVKGEKGNKVGVGRVRKREGSREREADYRENEINK